MNAFELTLFICALLNIISATIMIILIVKLKDLQKEIEINTNSMLTIADTLCEVIRYEKRSDN